MIRAYKCRFIVDGFLQEISSLVALERNDRTGTKRSGVLTPIKVPGERSFVGLYRRKYQRASIDTEGG